MVINVMKENKEGKNSRGGVLGRLAVFNRVVRKDPNQVNLSKDLKKMTGSHANVYEEECQMEGEKA